MGAALPICGALTRPKQSFGRGVGIDIWDDAGQGVVEHVTGVDDFKVAEATYRAAIARWPTVRIMLRQGARVVHESRATSEV
jgi:hypothetical protein